MAWTEVCKINFIQTLKHLTIVKGMSLRKALKKLSEESNIPFVTLERWFYDNVKESTIKNDGTTDDIEKTDKNNTSDDILRSTEWKCRSCEKTDVKPALNGSGKPFGAKSKFHNVCKACKTRMNRSKNESEGMEANCPHCGNRFFINWASVKHRLNSWIRKEEANGQEN